MYNSGRGRKMIQKVLTIAVLLLLVGSSTGYGQKIAIKGRVVDKDNKPVQGAQVKLVFVKKTITTDSDGKFFFDLTSSRTFTASLVSNTFSFQNGILSLDMAENQRNVQVEVFDNKGQRINKVIHNGIGKGTFSMNIVPENVPVTMYFVKLKIGTATTFFNVVNLNNRNYSLPGKHFCLKKSALRQSAKVVAIVDTLEASKENFQKTQLILQSYTTDLPDIVLKNTVQAVVLPPIVNGKSASTTRYWDCCKPHCGWQSNMKMCDINGKEINDRNAESGCKGGPSFQCWDYAPIEINDKVAYGWAAFNNSGTQCGDCFQLDFDGVLEGKQMIVQIINIGDGGQNSFDLLIPGGGVGANNGCSRQWNNPPLGVTYGGFHSTCGNNADCIRNMCKSAFGNKPDLMRGCEWYLNWFGMNSNPRVMYMKVSCPQEIKNISKIGN